MKIKKIGIIVLILAGFILLNAKIMSSVMIQNILHKVYSGYPIIRVTNSNVFLVSGGDTLVKPRSNFTNKEIKRLKLAGRYLKNSRREVVTTLSNILHEPVGTTIIPSTGFIKGHFIMKLSDTTLVNYNKFKLFTITRKSLNQLWGLVRYKIQEADSTYLLNAHQLGKFHYLVPYTCTVDSLRNYLNNPNSIPKWTNQIE